MVLFPFNPEASGKAWSASPEEQIVLSPLGGFPAKAVATDSLYLEDEVQGTILDEKTGEEASDALNETTLHKPRENLLKCGVFESKFNKFLWVKSSAQTADERGFTFCKPTQFQTLDGEQILRALPAKSI